MNIVFALQQQWFLFHTTTTPTWILFLYEPWNIHHNTTDLPPQPWAHYSPWWYTQVRPYDSSSSSTCWWPRTTRWCWWAHLGAGNRLCSMRSLTHCQRSMQSATYPSTTTPPRVLLTSSLAAPPQCECAWMFMFFFLYSTVLHYNKNPTRILSW